MVANVGQTIEFINTLLTFMDIIVGAICLPTHNCQHMTSDVRIVGRTTSIGLRICAMYIAIYESVCMAFPPCSEHMLSKGGALHQFLPSRNISKCFR